MATTPTGDEIRQSVAAAYASVILILSIASTVVFLVGLRSKNGEAL